MMSEKQLMWYDKPASEWIEALPLGNGRMGGMDFGGTEVAEICLDEETVWSGHVEDPNKHEAHEYLDEIREHIFNRRYLEAKKLTEAHFIGNETDGYGTHWQAGKLFIDFGHGDAKEYRRQLDLETALVSTSYKYDGATFEREFFATHADSVMVQRLTADKVGALNFKLDMESQHEDVSIQCDGSLMQLTGKCPDGGVSYCIAVRVDTKGGRVLADSSLEIRGADEAVLFIDIQTSFNHDDPAAACRANLDNAVSKGYAALMSDHLADYQALYSRVDMQIGSECSEDLPTNERVQAVKDGKSDPQLAALFFNYGRYLLIASSREDTLAGHLQGVWNDDKAAKMCWTCDYHFDINTEQNYWHAEMCNLPECHEAAFKLIESVVEPGRETAKHYFNAPGWVAQVFTNLWGYTPAGWSERWGIHPTGGTWMALHLAEHFDYTGDMDFLRERAYPLLKENAEFFLHSMVTEPETGYLVTCPSASPENVYFSQEGEPISVTAGPTCDNVLIRELFEFVIKAAGLLGIDEDFSAKLTAALKQLPPFQIGKHGQLQEWLYDFEEAEPEHRHCMHMLSLYPFAQITPEKAPELAAAVKTGLELKMGQPGYEVTEWGRAWNLCFYARLKEARNAAEQLQGLLKLCGGNLMTLCPPHGGSVEDIFVLDGNCAGAAGIAELLLQSHSGQLELLPALPSAWSEGAFRGLRTRGGFEVDMSWDKGLLQTVSIKSLHGGSCKVIYAARQATVTVGAGECLQLDTELNVIN